eukprot:TRINITY_DN3365_c0_g1_i2.p1 TRINITY_DN3365_c0_g1~~TRINITY_DN3365_c0_g1_i2.p1  ORF type:complete len:168 (-),score=33.74 TRINITY_DN3365_c0_g1_i2:91-594(-)
MIDEWDDAVGMPNNDSIVFSTAIAFVSMFPSALLSAILWFVQSRFSALGSYTLAMVPVFISNAHFVFMACMPTVYKRFWIFFDHLPRVEEELLMGLASCCFVSPFVTFEILLLYHMDKFRFLFVIIFIPLWVWLCLFCVFGCYICFASYGDTERQFAQIPPEEEEPV